MKKIFIILEAVCTIGIGASHAQEMKKGMSLFCVGMGLFPGVGLNSSYDYGLVDDRGFGILTVGGYSGYENWGKAYAGFGGRRANTFVLAPRATYRCTVNRTFELYAAAMLGAALDKDSGVFSSIIAGCRYTFVDGLSIFSEAGYNRIAYLNGGLCLAF
ncbi:MAG: hypothetical protein LBL04_04920 [Bacteroidales bacterium]|nr:hypothetical protein [Bacteroidales bacterium]